MFTQPEPLIDTGETFTIHDMEAAFFMSRDKLFNPDGTLRGYRFLNFQEFMEYRKQMIELSQNINLQSKNKQ